MLIEPAFAAMVATGIASPSEKIIIPTPAIIKPENIEFSKNMLLGLPITLGVLEAPKLPINVTYQSSNLDTAGRLTYTFTNQAIGTASSDRYVVVGIATVTVSTTAASATLTNIQVNGTSTTIAAQATFNSNIRSALGYLNVTAGTTANIVINITGTAQCMGLAVWTVTGPFNGVSGASNSSVVDDSGTVFTVTHPTVAPGNKIITIGRTGSAATTTWTNAVEDFDFLIENNQARTSGATSNIVSGASNYTITATISTTQTMRLSSARFYY